MNILVLGSTGMLGHKLLQTLGESHSVTGTVRNKSNVYMNHPILGDFNLIGEIHADNFSEVKTAIQNTDPDVVVNSIGIVKQLPEANDPVKSITINSLFPHQLACLCNESNIRLIHYSTDCVFSGLKGNYKETDNPDAFDLYGRTKLLGEVTEGDSLTIRTSIIGRELVTTHGLVEWFLSQNRKKIRGYYKSIFSGLTTNAHATILKDIINNFKNLRGLYHIASQPISKYDLLELIKETYQLQIDIEPDYKEICDRSLNSSKFYAETKIKIPAWSDMINDMYTDSTPYDMMRKENVHR